MAVTRALDGQTVVVTRTVAATQEVERTYRVVVDTALGEPYRVSVYRESVLRDEAGAIIKVTKLPVPVRREAAAVAAQSVTLASGKTITAGEIAEAIPHLCDAWAEEDR